MNETMTVLAIIGSPRGRGSGYRVVRRIEEELKRQGPTAVEYLFLKEQNLEPCRGCFVCVRRGEDRCPISDDRRAIEERIENADAVILASPCYVYNMSTLMKNLTDRLCYTNHRPRFFRQKLMLVANAGSGMEKTIEAMRHTLGPGPENVFELPYLSPPWPLAGRVEARQQRRIAAGARALYRAVQRDRGRGGLPATPSFGDYLRFRFFKKISTDVPTYLSADYAYYEEKQQYYHDTRIGPLKRIAAGLLLRVASVTMRDLAPAAEDRRAAATG